MNIYDDYAKKDIDIKNLRIRIKNLEEENRLLKDKLNAFESSKFNTMALLEIQHPKTAREAENLLQYKKVFEKLYNDKLYCLEEENRNLKEELGKFSEAYKRYRDYEKEELAESCYDFARENDKLKEENNRLKNNAMEDMRVQTKLEEENRKLREERDKWRGKYNRLKSEFNLLKNKIWTTKISK